MKQLIAANWKMNGSLPHLQAYVPALLAGLEESSGISARAVICPPSPYLPALAQMLKGSPVGVGAQNVHSSPKGAFTGEISVSMLADLGVGICIIGHSERRQLFGETDGMIRAKLEALLSAGLEAILCVGETLEEREAGRHESVVEGQVQAALAETGAEALTGLAVAYEPVWAIGTGKTATPEQANTMHGVIRTCLAGNLNAGAAANIPILYGGSVNTDNAGSLLSQSEINGALVGGASLEAPSFLAILKQAG